jgi:hypothetical protein
MSYEREGGFREVGVDDGAEVVLVSGKRTPTSSLNRGPAANIAASPVQRRRSSLALPNAEDLRDSRARQARR